MTKAETDRLIKTIFEHCRKQHIISSINTPYKNHLISFECKKVKQVCKECGGRKE